MKVGFVRSTKNNKTLSNKQLVAQKLYRLKTKKHHYYDSICILSYYDGIIVFTPSPVFLSHEHCQDLEFEELSRGDSITLTLTQE